MTEKTSCLENVQFRQIKFFPANSKNDSKNPFTQAQNEMKQNKNNDKIRVYVNGRPSIFESEILIGTTRIEPESKRNQTQKQKNDAKELKRENRSVIKYDSYHMSHIK